MSNTKHDKYDLKQTAYEAQHLGLDLGEIADIIAKWGPLALDVVVKALRFGFTLDLVTEILEAFGVEFLNKLLDRKLAALDTQHELRYSKGVEENDEVFASQPLHPEDDEKVSLNVSDALVEVLIKLIPQLMDKYALVLLQLIEDAILKALQSSQNKENLARDLKEVLD